MITFKLTLPQELKRRNNAFAKAEVSALNKTMAQGRTLAIRSIRSAYSVKAGAVRDDMKMKRASMSKPQVELHISATRLPVIDFSARQGSKGVFVTILRGARKLLKSRFIAKMPSGHKGVFERVTKKSLPIKEVKTLSVASMFTSRRVKLDSMLEWYIRMKLPEVYDHELQFYLNKP